MKRRAYQRRLGRLGAVALLLATGGLLAGCGEAEEPQDDTVLVFTSSIVSGHQHTLQLQRGLLGSPPPEGRLELLTSLEAGHEHEVELTAAELDTLDDGKSVTKQTSINDGHSHTFEMRRP